LTEIGIENSNPDNIFDIENINWYFHLSKCKNNTVKATCKPIEEINELIENLIITRKLEVPMLENEYMNKHLHDEFPFEIDKSKEERHLLNPNKQVYI